MFNKEKRNRTVICWSNFAFFRYLQNVYIYIYIYICTKLTLLNGGNEWTTDSNYVGSACALRVAAVAIANVSSCSDKLVQETVTAKMATKLFYLSVLIFSLCLYFSLSSEKVRNNRILN
jgi:hypothetical protein